MLETQKKAENLAILATLEQVGTKLIGFLGVNPPLDPLPWKRQANLILKYF